MCDLIDRFSPISPFFSCLSQSTLTRLDSLEQTIATLLEGIDDDDEIIEDPGLPSSESVNLPAVPLPDGVVPSNPPAPSRADS